MDDPLGLSVGQENIKVAHTQKNTGTVGCGDSTDCEDCFCVFAWGKVAPHGSRMIKRLQLQSDIQECTNTHTYKHPSLHGCPVKRVVVGCLQMDAYWAPGPREGHKRREKHSTGLYTWLLLRLFYYQLSHTVSEEINRPQPGFT